VLTNGEMPIIRDHSFNIALPISHTAANYSK
jgi:hypothetical protein